MREGAKRQGPSTVCLDPKTLWKGGKVTLPLFGGLVTCGPLILGMLHSGITIHFGYKKDFLVCIFNSY